MAEQAKFFRSDTISRGLFRERGTDPAVLNALQEMMLQIDDATGPTPVDELLSLPKTRGVRIGTDARNGWSMMVTHRKSAMIDAMARMMEDPSAAAAMMARKS